MIDVRGEIPYLHYFLINQSREKYYNYQNKSLNPIAILVDLSRVRVYDFQIKVLVKS